MFKKLLLFLVVFIRFVSFSNVLTVPDRETVTAAKSELQEYEDKKVLDEIKKFSDDEAVVYLSNKQITGKFYDMDLEKEVFLKSFFIIYVAKDGDKYKVAYDYIGTEEGITPEGEHEHLLYNVNSKKYSTIDKNTVDKNGYPKLENYYWTDSPFKTGTYEKNGKFEEKDTYQVFTKAELDKFLKEYNAKEIGNKDLQKNIKISRLWAFRFAD